MASPTVANAARPGLSASSGVWCRQRFVAVAGILFWLVVHTPAGGTQFFESEPNEPKFDHFNVIQPFAAGDAIIGNSTGGVTTPGTNSADYFLIEMQTNAPGIYRHRIVLTSPTSGHIGRLRGLNQISGEISAGSDAPVQTSTANTSPPRMNQFYTFGGASLLFYRVEGSVSTTSNYTATLESQAVTPVDLGAFDSGSITMTWQGQGHSTDTDIWVYDQNFNALPGYGNDDLSGSVFTSYLVRDFPGGRYYLAVSDSNLANHLASPNDDAYRNAPVMDYPGVAANSLTTSGLDLAFTISNGKRSVPVASTKAGPFDINWFVFQVTFKPTITNIVQSGSHVVMSGSGGPAGRPYYVLSSTSLTAPPNNWTSTLTNVFDAEGRFACTNAILAGDTQRFFQLSVPPVSP